MKNFIQYLTASGYSKNTIRAYTKDIKGAIHNQIIDYELSFFNEERLPSVSGARKRRIVASIKKYSKFLIKFKKITKLPLSLETVELPKVVSKIPKVLTPNEALKIIRAETDLEISAILHILYSTGCRIDSLANLKVEDIKEDYIEFKTSKGDKPYISVLVPITKEALKKFLKFNKKSGFLFTTKLGKQMSANNLRIKLKRKMGSRYINPHTWRHSVASALVNNGTDINVVRDFLNHSSIKTTERYVHLSAELKKKELAKGHPMLSNAVE